MFQKSFRGTAVELFGRTNDKNSGRRNQEWWTKDVEEAIMDKRAAWKKMEHIRMNGGEPDNRMKEEYGRKKNIARKKVAIERRRVNEELYNGLERDNGKKLIFKLAKQKEEDSRDMKGGSILKDSEGKLV